MSKVEHMVCPACAQMHGREHADDCPWNGLSGFMRPLPGESETYRAKLNERIVRERRPKQ